jgi:hypothetical protein
MLRGAMIYMGIMLPVPFGCCCVIIVAYGFPAA